MSEVHDTSAEIPPRRRSRPSMKDVAEAAGVSVFSVSSVLNKPERVSVATTEKVQQAIDDLGFVVNSAARSMKRGGLGTGFAIATHDLTHSFILDVVRGAQAEAHMHRRTLLVGNGDTDVDSMAPYIRLFDESRMEGVILSSVYETRQYIDTFRSHDTPVVVVNFRSAALDHCAVLMDNEKVGRDAAEHLLSRGCTRLLWLTESMDAQPLRDRLIGVRDAVERAGASLEIAGHQPTDEAARAFATRLQSLPDDRRPDGVIAGTALDGRWVIDSLHAFSQLTVPGDIRLVSTDGNRSAALGPVSLTMMVEPGRTMGAAAFRLLLAEASERSGDHEHRRIVLESVLHEGDSSA